MYPAICRIFRNEAGSCCRYVEMLAICLPVWYNVFCARGIR